MNIINRAKASLKFRAQHLIDRFREKLFFIKNFGDLKIKKNVILFYFTPYYQPPGGGILSILFLIEETVKMLKSATVLPVTLEKISNYKTIDWVKNPFVIANLCYLQFRLMRAESIIIHVPEIYFLQFCQATLKLNLRITKKLVVNILNQNEELMPPTEEVYRYKHLFENITITLAFEANQENSYPYSDIRPITLSTWFYGDLIEEVPYGLKQNLAIISNDPHPSKDDILKILERHGIKYVIVDNLPFDEFRQLQKVAKWSISFGEGYDGYSAMAFYKNGIGFGVYNPNFFPSNLLPLPKTFFISYAEMSSKIDTVLKELTAEKDYMEYVNSIKPKVIANNSPEKVVGNLQQYYLAVSKLVGRYLFE